MEENIEIFINRNCFKVITEVDNKYNPYWEKVIMHYLYDKYAKEVVGIAEIQIKKNFAYLGVLEIFEEFRGKGFGKLFMEVIVKHYTELYSRIDWDSYSDAVGFYEKLGYKMTKDCESWAITRFRVES